MSQGRVHSSPIFFFSAIWFILTWIYSADIWCREYYLLSLWSGANERIQSCSKKNVIWKLSIIWNKTSKRASKQYPNNSLLEFPLSRIYLKLSYQLKVSLETEHKYLLTQILSYVHLPISMILNISYFKNILLQKINKEIRAFFSVAHIYQIKILILCSII